MTENPLQSFAPVLNLIRQAQARALHRVNHELIELYWQIGEYLHCKTEQDGWGRGTVRELADWLTKESPEARGFSAQNLWRMKQFYKAYSAQPKLSALLRELTWTNNMTILGRAKSEQEREFYLQAAIQGRWTQRELIRQIDGSLYERALTNPSQLSPVLQEQQPLAASIFKESYLLDFLGLPKPHSEQDLQRGLVTHLKDFLMELGPDFAFMGEQYRVQVGRKDFFIDLLMYHRRLQALVAFELKVTEFSPEMMGQLQFYLEALDRDHRQPHEQPSIGVLLCASADAQVVEYALARSASPALVARYLTELPDKALLQAKLDEFYQADLAYRESLVAELTAESQELGLDTLPQRTPHD